MGRILLVRHAQSRANIRDFAAFGNKESPLTEEGIRQIPSLVQDLGRLGIKPRKYSGPVLSSEFTRTQETARGAGFNNIDTDPLVNEADVDTEIVAGINVIKKHKNERWVPDEVKQRAAEFIGRVVEGKMAYEVYFTHGMFIAAVLLGCKGTGLQHQIDFNDERGYVPPQASVTELTF